MKGELTASSNASFAQDGAAALLVLDLQVDFVEPHGRMPIARDQIGPMLAATNQAIAAAAAHRIAVVYIGNEFTRWDIPGNWFRHGAALNGTPGAALDPRLTRLDAAPYFAKRRGNAFSNPELGRFLRAHDIGSVVLSGVYAGACVSATAKAALGGGLKVTVLADAVGAASERARQAALAVLERRGAKIETTAAFIEKLGRGASPAG